MCDAKTRAGADPEEMARRGRIGAFVTHSRHDPAQTTARAREAFLARFEREVDPEHELPIAERQRRAGYARKAHFARLARLSALARQRGPVTTAEGEPTASGGAA